MQNVIEEQPADSNNTSYSDSEHTQNCLDDEDASSSPRNSDGTSNMKFETSSTECLLSELNATDDKLTQSPSKTKQESSTDPIICKRTLKRTARSLFGSSDESSGLNEVKFLKTESAEPFPNSTSHPNEDEGCGSSSKNRPNNFAHAIIKGTQSKTAKAKPEGIKQSDLNNDKEIFNDNLDNTSDPEDGNDKDASIGSELIIAAYNNFVRRLIDDTLDRSVTFCEQPRHAITALENMCSKAWPNLESKRHRNRIRAYLKACRRNSKKNRGFINMKEPPTNGLSMEARHLVTNALTIVSNELEELKKCLNLDETKRNTLPNSKTEHFEVTTTNPNSDSSSQDDHQFPFEFSPLIHQGSNLAHPSNIGDKFKIPRTTWNPVNCTTNQFSSHSLNGDLTGTMSNSFSTANSLIPYLGFDPNYMASMLRFLPTTSQYQFMGSLNTNNPFMSSLQFPFGCSTKNDLNESLFNSNNSDPNNISNDFWISQNNVKRSNEKDHLLHANEERFSNHSRNQTAKSQDTDMKYAPPPAHFSSAHYSPIMNRAMGKLMNHCALSQDDINFFRQNIEFTKEAIKYARGVSRLILKKVELLENQIHSSTNGPNLAAINLT